MIVTSQSILVKQSGTEIQPGSQLLLLWNSYTGHALLGISGAHTMQCPVVIPHPSDSSLLCSAAADGTISLWDWESGQCVFSHKNNVEYGPAAEGGNRPKISGYLDGAFSPDGTRLVLTDDAGRITILDCSASVRCESSRAAANWMKEQYFANDYYELIYDSNGYCIERGSGQPPHLAPKGVRSNHSFAPLPDDINEAFKNLVGPQPLPEVPCRWRRQHIRGGGQRVGIHADVNPQGSMVGSGIREFDREKTIMIKGPGHVDLNDKRVVTVRSGQGRENSAQNTAMSSNYRWRDYEDLMREQGNGNDEDDIDADDEEFEPTASRARVRDQSDDSEDLDPDEVDYHPSPQRERRGQGRRRSDGEARRQRAQRRAQRRDDQFVEIGSDDEMVAQFVSTNTSPSGPFLRDYNVSGHLWRIIGSRNIARAWLRRQESNSSYYGRRTYCPQVGDSVVYIPRAHFETIKEFPNLNPPWQSWPQGSVWPVVRCCIRGVRYRFPYEGYNSRDR